jgi:hypothetical protein
MYNTAHVTQRSNTAQHTCSNGCTENVYTCIAGLIPQSLQFRAQVTLAKLFLKGFIALININHTCKLQNCSLTNQFTTVSLQMHVGEFDLAKISAVKNITQYTKNTAATGWNYSRRCLVRFLVYFLYRCWRSTMQ